MAFYSGQKVVCIDAKRDDVGAIGRGLRWIFGRDWPIEGGVYTVLRPHVMVTPIGVGVVLFEIKNSWIVLHAFRISRFRPLVESKTDISVFTEILRTTKAPALTSQDGGRDGL